MTKEQIDRLIRTTAFTGGGALAGLLFNRLAGNKSLKSKIISSLLGAVSGFGVNEGLSYLHNKNDKTTTVENTKEPKVTPVTPVTTTASDTTEAVSPSTTTQLTDDQKIDGWINDHYIPAVEDGSLLVNPYFVLNDQKPVTPGTAMSGVDPNVNSTSVNPIIPLNLVTRTLSVDPDSSDLTKGIQAVDQWSDLTKIGLGTLGLTKGIPKIGPYTSLPSKLLPYSKWVDAPITIANLTGNVVDTVTQIDERRESSLRNARNMDKIFTNPLTGEEDMGGKFVNNLLGNTIDVGKDAAFLTETILTRGRNLISGGYFPSSMITGKILKNPVDLAVTTGGMISDSIDYAEQNKNIENPDAHVPSMWTLLKMYGGGHEGFFGPTRNLLGLLAGGHSDEYVDNLPEMQRIIKADIRKKK